MTSTRPIGFWGLIVEPGKMYSQQVPVSFKITMATFGPETYKIEGEGHKMKSGRSVVMLTHQKDGEFALCSLCPGKHDQQPLDTVFLENDTIHIRVTGEEAVHLTGYYIDDNEHGMNGGFDSEELEAELNGESLDEEDEEDDEDDDSCCEDDMCSREKKSHMLENEEDDDAEEEDDEGELSGDFIDDDEIEEEISSDEEDEMQEDDRIKIVNSDDEDEEDSEDDAEDESENDEDIEASIAQIKARRISQITSEDEEDDEEFEAIEEDSEDDQVDLSQDSDSENEITSSNDEEIDSDTAGDLDESDSQEDSEEEQEEQVMTLSKKRKSKENIALETTNENKKKNKVEKVAKEEIKTSSSSPSPSQSKAVSKVLPSGLKIEDVHVGAGIKAQKGRLVTASYEIQSPNGKVIEKSKTPLQFSLGDQSICKAFGIGIQGMALGGERELTVPSSMTTQSDAKPALPANKNCKIIIKLEAVEPTPNKKA